MQFALAVRHDAALAREMHEQWALRFQTPRQVFERAAARGEWPPRADPWPLMQGLIGAVYLRVFVLREPVTPRYLRPLLDCLLMQSGPALGPQHAIQRSPVENGPEKSQMKLVIFRAGLCSEVFDTSKASFFLRPGTALVVLNLDCKMPSDAKYRKTGGDHKRHSAD